MKVNIFIIVFAELLFCIWVYCFYMCKVLAQKIAGGKIFNNAVKCTKMWNTSKKPKSLYSVGWSAVKWWPVFTPGTLLAAVVPGGFCNIRYIAEREG